MKPHARPVFPLRVANNRADPLRTHVSHTLDHGALGGQKIRSSAQTILPLLFPLPSASAVGSTPH
jgi:hypothetical protein